MANKNVYFFKVDLFYRDEMINYQELKNVIKKIFDEHARKFNNYKSLDVTPYGEDMHFMLDVYDYENVSFFARMSKQKPSNSLVQHDYRTQKKEDVLPGNNENERGIEQYTYGYLRYDSGIFMLASTQGAPSEKIINYLLEIYAPEYGVEMVPIPNKKAMETIYASEESEITRLEIEVPMPEPGVLEHILGWNEKEILASLSERNLCASMVIKSSVRGKSITEGEEATQSVMNLVKSHLLGYNKAKMKARARNLKLREYNFFDDKFSYPMEVSNYHVVAGEKSYYSVENLAEIYRHNMRSAYNENEKLLKIILDR